jgi:hypothetical protein
MTSSVNPVSAQAIYPSSYSSGINSATGNDGDGSSVSGAVSGHHRHSHGGAFMQNVMQALQTLGVSSPASR